MSALHTGGAGHAEKVREALSLNPDIYEFNALMQACSLSLKRNHRQVMSEQFADILGELKRRRCAQRHVDKGITSMGQLTRAETRTLGVRVDNNKARCVSVARKKSVTVSDIATFQNASDVNKLPDFVLLHMLFDCDQSKFAIVQKDILATYRLGKEGKRLCRWMVGKYHCKWHGQASPTSRAIEMALSRMSSLQDRCWLAVMQWVACNTASLTDAYVAIIRKTARKGAAPAERGAAIKPLLSSALASRGFLIDFSKYPVSTATGYMNGIVPEDSTPSDTAAVIAHVRRKVVNIAISIGVVLEKAVLGGTTMTPNDLQRLGGRRLSILQSLMMYRYVFAPDHGEVAADLHEEYSDFSTKYAPRAKGSKRPCRLQHLSEAVKRCCATKVGKRVIKATLKKCPRLVLYSARHLEHA